MNLERTFKRIIILQFIVCVYTIFYTFLFAEIEENPENKNIILDYIYLIFGIIYLFNFILLYKFLRIAKVVYITSLGISFIISFLDPYAFAGLDNVSNVLGEIGYLIDGILLSMILFSDIKKKFKNDQSKN